MYSELRGMKYTILFYSVCLFIALVLMSCTSKTNQKPMVQEQSFELPWPQWAKNANIYEVNIRQYTQEGTFNAFADHLPRLKEMGVDILWFMPVFPISYEKRKGTLGSYYAVSDFRSVNPEFGTMDDFKRIIEMAHKLGMYVILDWVPNHTGWDHTWINDNPEYYTKNDEGEVTDPLDENGKSMGWSDVADLNYNNFDMRLQMQEDMMYWLREHQIDGFRHDMALLVPLDFWQSTIKELRSVRSDLFMLAESEDHDHTNKDCFHAIYSWSLHHILNDVAQGKKTIKDIDTWYQNERPKLKKGAYMLFTSNHDENSWSGSEIERMGEAHQAFAVLVNTLDGISLMYSGQEEPLYKRLEFFEKDSIGFGNYSYANFYRTLHQLKHENSSLWNAEFGGSMNRIMPDENVFAFERVNGDNKVIVIINLSKQMNKPRIDRMLHGKEVFTGKAFNFNVGDELILKPWEYIVVTSTK